MMQVVTHHDGLDAGLEAAAETGLEAAAEAALWPGAAVSLDRVVPGNDRLDAKEQLQIYAFMYFARLIEVLEVEYPTVMFLVGPDRFAQLARMFLREQPSNHYNLARLSIGFPAFLATLGQDQLHSGFAAALAEVERAMEDVADDVEQASIPYDQLAAIPAERWASARLRPIEAMRLLRVSHPVSDFMNGVQGDWFVAVPEPVETFMCVYRTAFRCRRQELGPEQFQLLSSLTAGSSLGEAIETAASLPGADTDKMMQYLGSWFEQWMEDAMFAEIGSS